MIINENGRILEQLDLIIGEYEKMLTIIKKQYDAVIPINNYNDFCTAQLINEQHDFINNNLNKIKKMKHDISRLNELQLDDLKMAENS